MELPSELSSSNMSDKCNDNTVEDIIEFRDIMEFDIDVISPSRVPESAAIIAEGTADGSSHVCLPEIALQAIKNTLTPRKLTRYLRKEASGGSDMRDPVFTTWSYLKRQAAEETTAPLSQIDNDINDHPLMQSGLIPRRLVDVFHISPEKEQPGIQKRVTKAMKYQKK